MKWCILNYCVYILDKKSEESDLPEVDQNTNKALRKQKVK